MKAAYIVLSVSFKINLFQEGKKGLMLAFICIAVYVLKGRHLFSVDMFFKGLYCILNMVNFSAPKSLDNVCKKLYKLLKYCYASDYGSFKVLFSKIN